MDVDFERIRGLLAYEVAVRIAEFFVVHAGMVTGFDRLSGQTGHSHQGDQRRTTPPIESPLILLTIFVPRVSACFESLPTCLRHCFP